MKNLTGFQKASFLFMLLVCVSAAVYIGNDYIGKKKQEYLGQGYNLAGQQFVAAGQQNGSVEINLNGVVHRFVYVKPTAAAAPNTTTNTGEADPTPIEAKP